MTKATNWKTKVIARGFGAASIGRYAPTHNIDALLHPAGRALLKAAAVAGEVRADIDADGLLEAATSLWAHDAAPGRAERMVALIADGLRYGVHRCECMLGAAA